MAFLFAAWPPRRSWKSDTTPSSRKAGTSGLGAGALLELGALLEGRRMERGCGPAYRSGDVPKVDSEGLTAKAYVSRIEPVNRLGYPLQQEGIVPSGVDEMVSSEMPWARRGI